MPSEDLALLFELQQADSAIDEREALLAGIDDGTSAKKDLEAAHAAADAAAAEVSGVQVKAKDLELQLQSIDAEKKEKSDRAYGGTVSDPKELTALEAKLAELDRNTSRVEDLTLEVLESLEEAQTKLDEATAARDGAQATHAQITSAYDDQTLKARTELDQLRAKRDELLTALPPALVKQYEDLRARLGGVAIVALDGSICTGCNLSVPSTLVIRVERGVGVIKCESCRRMLCIPPK